MRFDKCIYNYIAEDRIQGTSLNRVCCECMSQSNVYYEFLELYPQMFSELRICKMYFSKIKSPNVVKRERSSCERSNKKGMFGYRKVCRRYCVVCHSPLKCYSLPYHLSLISCLLFF